MGALDVSHANVLIWLRPCRGAMLHWKLGPCQHELQRNRWQDPGTMADGTIDMDRLVIFVQDDIQNSVFGWLHPY